MTINQMAVNFDILARVYFYGAIAYIIFIFCCHIITVFQELKTSYRLKNFTASQNPHELFFSQDKTLRQIREYVRIHNLQTQIKSVVGRSVSHCSKDELIKALA